MLEVADGDETRAAAHSKLVLLWRPLDAASGSVDPENDQGGLPCALFQGPHVGVAVCSAGDDAVTVRSPVDTCQDKRSPYQLIQYSPLPLKTRRGFGTT